MKKYTASRVLGSLMLLDSGELLSGSKTLNCTEIILKKQGVFTFPKNSFDLETFC